MRRLTERSEVVSKLIPDEAARNALSYAVDRISDPIGELASHADDAVSDVFNAALEAAHKQGMELTEDLAMEILEAAREDVEQQLEISIESMVYDLWKQHRRLGNPMVDFAEPDEGQKAEPHDFSVSWR